MLIDAFNHALRNGAQEGDFIFEFGVASGTTYIQLATRIAAHNYPVKLIGFDSFQGLPKEAEGVWRHNWHVEGEFAYSVKDVENRLALAGLLCDDRFWFVHGFYDWSLKQPKAIDMRSHVKRLLLINIDVDLYISTCQLLEYCLPVLGPGTVLYFDDWKDPTHRGNGEWGEHRAWREFTEAYPNIQYKTIKIGSANERFMEIEAV